MASAIPIQNIYYLLSYAWDLRALQGRRALAVENAPSVLDLLARLFAEGVASLRRPGLDRNYLETCGEIALIRGKPDFSESNKRLSRLRSRMVCRFEELNPDILHNRILKSTLHLLLACDGLDKETRPCLHLPREQLREITPVSLNAGVFQRIQIHRNNRHYRLLLNICELLWKQLLPSDEPGQMVFRDFLEEEAVMSGIFEKFVFNFTARHFPEATTSADWISWDGEAMDELSGQFLPKMKTDVCVAWPTRKLILDCKFYKRATLPSHEVEKLRSGHLYQIFSYLKNKSVIPGWNACEGILLYPTVEEAFDCHFKLGGHPVRTVTLDLNRPWQEIERDLLSILSGNRSLLPETN
jgi:5-methylcytosine-specific restriction enzyme subunit McrC